MTYGKHVVWALILALGLCVPAARAQQKDPRVAPAQPLPPLSPGESSSRTAAAETPPAAPAQQDRQPLTSAEPWTLGRLAGGRSFVIPGVSFYQQGDTNPVLSAGGGQAEAVSSFSGHLTLQQVWGTKELLTDYAGGTQFHSPKSDLNSAFHQFGLSYRAKRNRWTFLFADQANYSRGGLGGAFGGLPRLGTTGPGAGSIDGLFSSSQSILNGRVPRIDNSVLGEAQYNLSRRSTVTFSGTYSLLRFLGSGFIDGSTKSFRTGYNYALNRQDTIALDYTVNFFRFEGTDRRVGVHYVYLSYGRQVARRLALQIGAGPQINTLQEAVSGSRTALSWSLRTALLYQYSRGDLRLSYFRGIEGGSGVLAGAKRDSVELAVSRKLSRIWNGTWDAGYAHKAELAGTSGAPGVLRFNTWSAGAQLNRPMGRYTRIFFSYRAERQTATLSGSNVSLRHMFGVGFDFRFRPIEID